MQAARLSEDPVTVGSSARIITHALMDDGHFGAAATTASRFAQRLDHDVDQHNPDSLSVYGSLHPPGTGSERTEAFPWQAALSELDVPD
jgi:hypothetical protein